MLAILAATLVLADLASSAEFSVVCEMQSVAAKLLAIQVAIADVQALAIAVADAKTFALNFESVPLKSISGTIRNGATGVPKTHEKGLASQANKAKTARQLRPANRGTCQKRHNPLLWSESERSPKQTVTYLPPVRMMIWWS